MGIIGKKGRPYRDELTKLEQIFNWFIAPLFDYKPEQITDQVFLEWLFDTRNRSIKKYRAKERFDMPGLYVEVPNVRIQGFGYRRVKKTAIIWVRHDRRNPGRYQISFQGGQGNREWVYDLSKSEWESIEKYLRPYDEEDDEDQLRH